MVGANLANGSSCNSTIGFTPITSGPLSTELEFTFYFGATKIDMRYSIAGVGGGAVSVTPVQVVEFYNKGQDHYFMTWIANEIAILDAGVTIKGWARTGYSFNAYPTVVNGTSPVCRFYIPPGLGDSHFYGRGTQECNDTAAQLASFVNEDPTFMFMFLPTAGTCPAKTTEVFRVFDNRPDTNHRYMTDTNVRAQMVALGWIAEGDGPDLVVMCAPQ